MGQGSGYGKPLLSLGNAAANCAMVGPAPSFRLEGSDDRSHRASRLHHAARRRGGCVAACSARAADGKAPDHRARGGAIPSTQGTWIAAFVQRMRELGWIENRAVAI